jgi:hypothetical protein
LLKTYCDNVYYQPPESTKLKYPCIIYSRENIDTQKADNKSYLVDCAYSMRYITKDPDDDVPFALVLLPFCRHSRHYVADNLHHDSFTIYY